MKKILFSLISLFSFTQGMANDIVWSIPPTLLSTSNLNASNPQISTDASGNLVALWIENGLVKSKSKLLNMNWDAGATLSPFSPSVGPAIVCDLAGNATAIWLENGIVKAASKPFMSNWSQPSTLSNGGAGIPALAVNTTGDVVAAWPRHGNIETSTKMFGGSWGGTQVISSSNAANPQIAIARSSANANAVVVWQSSSATLSSISASTKPLTGNWSAAQVISDPLHNAATPVVAMDLNGNATALWFKYDVVGTNYFNVVVQSAERLANAQWGSAASLSSSGIRNPATLVARVAYDSVGNAVALWNTSFDNDTFSIQGAVKPLRGVWDSPVDIVSSNTYGLDADLKANNLGDALALYMFYNGQTLSIQSAESDITGFMNDVWSVPILVSAGMNNGSPRTATTLAGNAIKTAAIWLSSNGMQNQVFASTGSKSLPLPPSNLSVSQNVSNLGVYTDYYNLLSWTASADPTVVGYLIYRNGTFLEQVSNTTTQFADHNRVQNGAVAYEIASVNNQNTHSAIVSVNFP